jgi:hypothetical protein
MMGAIRPPNQAAHRQRASPLKFKSRDLLVCHRLHGQALGARGPSRKGRTHDFPCNSVRAAPGTSCSVVEALSRLRPRNISHAIAVTQSEPGFSPDWTPAPTPTAFDPAVGVLAPRSHSHPRHPYTFTLKLEVEDFRGLPLGDRKRGFGRSLGGRRLGIILGDHTQVHGWPESAILAQIKVPESY